VFVTTHQNTQCLDPEPSTSSSLSYLTVTEARLPRHTVDTEHDDVGGFFASRSASDSNINVNMETCSVVYFAGWLGKSCIDKYDCSDCKKILLKNQVDLTDRKQLLLINKTYSNSTTTHTQISK
jgi:hypothetical protein